MSLNELTNRLQNHGLRLTKPRSLILEALISTEKPISAYRLQDEMTANGMKVHIVSVYRTLAVLQELGIIHYIPSQQGYLLCTESCESDRQTEHLVCDTCGLVTEIPMPSCATNDLLEQAQSHGFRMSKIRVEVEGTCNNCQKTPH